MRAWKQKSVSMVKRKYEYDESVPTLAECSLCISLVSMVYLESKNSLFAIQEGGFLCFHS